MKVVTQHRQQKKGYKRDLNSVNLGLEYGASLGIPATTLLAKSGISSQDLTSLNTLIDAQQELQVFDNLLQQIGDPYALGMELGSRYQLTSYGLFGYTMLASDTLGKAVEFGLRFMGLTYVFSDFELSQDKGRFYFQLSPQLSGELGTLMLVRDIWAVIVIYSELLAEDNLPLALELAFPRPISLSNEQLAALKNSFSLGVSFSCANNRIIGDKGLLDKPLSKGNQMTATLCEQECVKLLQQKQQWLPLSVQIRDLLVSAHLDLSMEQAAQALGKTSRTLHRLLAQEGTSWRKVRDDVRIGLAEELLNQPLQLSEIAERLGYSDTANFSHSFKRCKGISPSEFRKHSR